MKNKNYSLLFGLFALISCALSSCGEGPIIPPDDKIYHTITFDSMGGSPVPSQTVEKTKTVSRPLDPVLNGSIFDYWFEIDDGIPYSFSSLVDHDMTLHAKWSIPEPTKYMISWVVEGVTTKTQHNVGARPVSNLHPVKTQTSEHHFTFDGWMNEGVVSLESELPLVTKDATYIAHFNETIRSYTIIWKNGSTLLKEDMNVPYGTMPEYDGVLPTRPSDVDFDYPFIGWSPEVLSVTKDQTYEARFEKTPKDPVFITFNSNGGLPITSVVLKKGDVLVDPEIPSYYNHSFLEWCTDPALTNPITQPFLVNTDTTLYAKWDTAYITPTDPSDFKVVPFTTATHHLNKLNKKIKVEKSGYHFVDYINPKNKISIMYDEITYEMDAILFGLQNLDATEKSNILSQTSSMPIINSNFIQLFSLLDSKLSYENMYKYLDEVHCFFEYPIMAKYLLDPSDYDNLTTLDAPVSLTPIYVGISQDFNEEQTDIIFYTISKDISDNLYVGVETSPVGYSHIASYTVRYKSYQYDILFIHVNTPLADITVYLDRFGKEVMVLEDSFGSFDSLYISRDFHWQRNDYNIKSIDGKDFQSLRFEDLVSRSSWALQNPVGSYFHQIGSGNNTNGKFVNPTKFYEWTTDSLCVGSNEAVFQGREADSVLDFKSLVTYSYNFGAGGIEFDLDVPDFTLDVNMALPHYFKDVYPYLLWGNDFYDFLEHTAFERFVWDKDSANVEGIALVVTTGNDSAYKAKKSIGRALTALYTTGIVGDANGEPIPNIVQFIYQSSLFALSLLGGE